MKKTTGKIASSKTEEKFDFEPSSIGESFASQVSLGSIGNETPVRGDFSTQYLSNYNILKFNNLVNLRLPYQESGGFLNIREVIRLTQTAYYNVPVFNHTIEIMTELTNTGIKLTGGSLKARQFYKTWHQKVNLFNLCEQFFRECYRSSNMFLYRYDGGIKLNKINKFILGEDKAKSWNKENTSEASKTIDLPLRYILLNPADICTYNDLSLNYMPSYYRIMDTSTRTQIKRLIKESTVKISQDDELKKILNLDLTQSLLDQTKLYPLFYKKQDYEPFAMPFGYPVLEDINLKLELKKCDAVVAKTVESIIMLVTHGAKPEDGGMNPKVDSALKQVFTTKQTGRTVVSDYTTKIDFVIPDLNKVLGPQKYAKIDQDINDGLMNLFFGEQKFANITVKLRVFIARLIYGQNIFLNDFWQHEMVRVGKLVGFEEDEIPIAKFNKIRVEDTTNSNRIIAQLLQLGILTDKDGIEAMETGLLPDYDDLISNQKDYKKQRDDGLFFPLVGGSQPNDGSTGGGAGAAPTINKTNGRPPKSGGGTKMVNPAPKGASASYNIQTFRKNVLLANEIINDLESSYCERIGKGKLSKREKHEIELITTHLMTNEICDDWKAKSHEYLDKLPEPNIERIAMAMEIKEEEQVDEFTSALLLSSKHR